MTTGQLMLPETLTPGAPRSGQAQMASPLAQPVLCTPVQLLQRCPSSLHRAQPGYSPAVGQPDYTELLTGQKIGVLSLLPLAGTWEILR